MKPASYILNKATPVNRQLDMMLDEERSSFKADTVRTVNLSQERETEIALTK